MVSKKFIKNHYILLFKVFLPYVKVKNLNFANSPHKSDMRAADQKVNKFKIEDFEAIIVDS